MKKALIPALVLAFALPAMAQQIQWKPVTAGNMQWANTPGNRTTFTQIGPVTIGSDGSRAYTTSNTSVSPDGASAHNLGQIVYIRGQDGRQVRCTKYGENMFCE